MPNDVQAEKIAFLAERVTAVESTPARTTFDVPFRQGIVSLTKIEVPIGFPLYNLHSGRTHRAQTKWLERNDVEADYFEDDFNPDAQRTQHDLLMEMVGEKGLPADLADREQRNPVVLTHDGILIDGNRRVATLRDQGAVEHVVAVVLPADADRHDQYATELELQMALDTRADYHWIDELLHVRYGITKLGEPVHSVARRMNDTEQAVNELISRLGLVDAYLAWLGAPSAFHVVRADSEQSFIELHERVSSPQTLDLPPAHQDAIRFAGFAVISDENGGYKDVRNVANMIRTQPAAVLARVRDRIPEELAGRLDQPLEPAVEGVADAAIDALLADLEDAATGTATPEAGVEIVHLLRDPDDAKVVIPTLMEVAQDLTEEGKESAAPLKKVNRALTALRGVDINIATPQLAQIRAALDEIDTELTRIRGSAAEQ